MKYAFVLLAVCCLLSSVHAQWQHRFGGDSLDRGTAVLQTTDGGYLAAGFTSSFGAGRRDVYLVRTDALATLSGLTATAGARMTWPAVSVPHLTAVR